MRDSKIAICISDYSPLGIEYGDVFIVEDDTKLKGFLKDTLTILQVLLRLI